MTELLFHTDSYVRTFEARVTAVDAERSTLVLERTAFYPGGGGQPHDIGTLHWRSGATGDTEGAVRAAVTKVTREGPELVHRLGRPPGAARMPAVGELVEGSIDWEHRYRLMRTHTAMHILCGVVWRDWGAPVTGGNMAPLEGRLDFEFEHLQRELVDEIEAKINAEVEAAREVRVAVLGRAEAEQIPDLIRTKINLVPASISEIRTVEIVGLDLQADGGTHVANTREVGPLKVIGYKSKGRINKRIRVGLEDA